MMRLIAGILVFAVVFFADCGKKDNSADARPPVPVKVEKVLAQDVRRAYRYSGEIQPDIEVKLSFKQAGYVASLHQVREAGGRMRNVQVGDRVPAGTVLAQLRQGDFLASVTQATGQEMSSESSVAAAQATLEQAKADAVKAEQNFRRAEALYAAKALTRPDYDDAVAQYKESAAEVESAKQQIGSRQGQAKTAKGHAAVAKIALADANLVTPMPSVIVSKDVEPGSLVSVGTLGFTVGDTRVVKMEFGVPDSMIAQFHAGSQIAIQVEALGVQRLPGHVTLVSASADSDSRVFKIQVSVPNRDQSLKVGMIASVEVNPAGPDQPMPLVPATALSTSGSGTTNYAVFVVSESNGRQIAQLRSVRTGETVGRSIVIREGLTPGERIIVNRPNQLVDGSFVRVVD